MEPLAEVALPALSLSLHLGPSPVATIGAAGTQQGALPPPNSGPGRAARLRRDDSLPACATSQLSQQLAVAGTQPCPYPPGSGWDPGHWGAPHPVNPPPMKATFDGSPAKLTFFPNQVWAHLD